MRQLLLILIFSSSILQAQENSTVIYNEGRKLALNMQFEEAAEKFKRSIELSPYYVLPHYGLGRCYLNIDGKRAAAIREFKIAISLDKKFSPSYFYLGMAYMFEQQYAYALTTFQKAFLYDGTRIEALYNIGAVYDLMGHPNKSLIYYDRYLRAKKIESEYSDI